MKNAVVIGLMSGTSLDGLDIAAVRFDLENLADFELIASECINYSSLWKEKLEKAMSLSALEITQLDHELGTYFGHCVQEFIRKNKLQPDLISSHGHTVFHQPDKNFTLQIGNTATIAAITNNLVAGDFRSLDMQLGGQGAPLVPVGDELLFGQYDMCLNLGGIANISLKRLQKRIAFDICPANMALNPLAKQLGAEYDKGGEWAKAGKINEELLAILNELEFYQQPVPRSLGKEWYNAKFAPVVNRFSLSTKDLLRTVTEHIAMQTAETIQLYESTQVLATGGGAYNHFLIERIGKLSGADIIIPGQETIEFKEAIIFALLGFLRINNQVNTLSSVTGAIRDSIGGCVYDGRKA